MLLSDKSIRALAEQGMIVPFVGENVRQRIYRDGEAPTPLLSHGLSSCGYDVSLQNSFKLFTDVHGGVIDPKRADKSYLMDVEAKLNPETGEHIIQVPPHSYALGHTKEWFNIPKDIGVIVLGKSTYARSGIIINCTPIEPGFQGEVVIEIANSTHLPAKIYADEGIAQFFFFRMDQECETGYGDRSGKYQGQRGITLSKA